MVHLLNTSFFQGCLLQSTKDQGKNKSLFALQVIKVPQFSLLNCSGKKFKISWKTQGI